MCQICGPGWIGSGFLIAPDLVLTCFHVVRRLIEGSDSVASVQARFDFRERGEGERTDNGGTWVALDPAWDIPWSPTSPADAALGGDPAANELDFAILKLVSRVGEESVPGTASIRGWVDLSQDPPTPLSPILIVQHPAGQPVKVASAHGPVHINSAGTRISYPTDTLPGSSGSPVFDRSLRAVAMHHRSGPSQPGSSNLAENNRGVPLGRIRAALPEAVAVLLVTPPAQLRSLPHAHLLPGPVADFTGREAEISALAAHLEGDDATYASMVIRGMGGIGKTQLALAVAQRLRARYPDQLMFELQPGATPVTPEALLGRIIHAHQPDVQLPETLEELLVHYRSALAGHRGLLLLDNAAGGAQVRLFVPPPTGWVVIVRSRTRFALEGGKAHDLELLSVKDAMRLLARMLADGGRGDLEGVDLEPLAKQCGRLPLALRLAAGYLSSAGSRTLQSFLAALEGARLKYLQDPHDERTIEAVLGVTVERLTGERGKLARRWRELGVFAAPFDLPAAAAVWAIGEAEAQDDLDELCRQSLVEYGPGQYSLHDLLLEIARCEPLEDDIHYRHARHYLDRSRDAVVQYLAGQHAASAGLSSRNRSPTPAADTPPRLLRKLHRHLLDIRPTTGGAWRIMQASYSGDTEPSAPSCVPPAGRADGLDHRSLAPLAKTVVASPCTVTSESSAPLMFRGAPNASHQFCRTDSTIHEWTGRSRV